VKDVLPFAASSFLASAIMFEVRSECASRAEDTVEDGSCMRDRRSTN
jgi:hypothetical protein